MMEKSVAEGELMDPKLQIGLLNLPTDTFDFDQEPMTQFKVSYIQQFPSGDSRRLPSWMPSKKSSTLGGSSSAEIDEGFKAAVAEHNMTSSSHVAPDLVAVELSGYIAASKKKGALCAP